MDATGGRRGRKAHTASPGERVSLGLKVTPDIKNKLDAAARINGRSQSQEAEARIEQSFRAELQVDDALELIFGRRLAGLLLAAGHVMRETGGIAAIAVARHRNGNRDEILDDENWLNDAYCADQAIQAANTILEAVRPAGETTPEWAQGLEGSKFPEIDHPLALGRNRAERLLISLTSPAPDGPIYRIQRSIWKKLGSEMVGRIAKKIQTSTEGNCR